MPALTITIGCPGSGKTTWAKEQVRRKGNTVLVCRDDFRDQLFGGLQTYKFSKTKEQLVTDAQKAAIVAAFNRGQNVIVADTHCSSKYLTSWKQFAKEHNATFSTHDMFKAYLKEQADAVATRGLDGVMGTYRARCQKWNLTRLNSVPPEVVDEMFDRYLDQIYGFKIPQHIHHENLQKAAVFDIDGTLAHMLDLRGPFDWKKVGVDKVDLVVAEIMSMYRTAGYAIIVMSGRDGVCEPETRQWLKDNNLEYDYLFMRAPNDQRNDGIVKQELFMDKVDGNFNVHVCFDDRNRVVDRWRAMGIKCLQCEPGNF